MMPLCDHFIMEIVIYRHQKSTLNLSCSWKNFVTYILNNVNSIFIIFSIRCISTIFKWFSQSNMNSVNVYRRCTPLSVWLSLLYYFWIVLKDMWSECLQEGVKKSVIFSLLGELFFCYYLWAHLKFEALSPVLQKLIWILNL